LVKSKLLRVTARLFLVYICRVHRSITADSGRYATREIQHYQIRRSVTNPCIYMKKENRTHFRRTVGRFT
jgi:hypothetical protein